MKQFSNNPNVWTTRAGIICKIFTGLPAAAFAALMAIIAILATNVFAENISSLPRIRVAQNGHGFETEHGKPFVPFGVSYYRPGQGWAPQLWKKFDAEATRKDFARMKSLGVNCVRVFLSYGSFMTDSNEVSPEGLAKFDQFLQVAEEAGIYVHPTGPDLWEGTPDWVRGDRIADERLLAAVENFWRQFAARYRNRKVIFSYDLLNEPMVGWDTPPMREKWNRWLEKKYRTTNAVAAAWQLTNGDVTFGSIPVPPQQDCAACARLLDFQNFRESIADEWTRRQVAAIKSVAPDTLVTIGLIQWSVPSVLPASWVYSGFRPDRQAQFLDYLTIHFYPLANGHYDYKDDDEAANLAYLDSVMHQVAQCGKPAVIGEFGWYGGGKLTYGKHPFITEEQQAQWCRKVVESTAGLACGWLNWGFYDQPEANDVSQLTGLLTADGKMKAWGREFQKLAKRYKNRKLHAPRSTARQVLDWNLCITSAVERRKFAQANLKAWKAAH